ncbi:hypothetical protein ACIBG7_07600 [Nonomuraea sp. NPDC050328]|uniref:hypothetical protein n=1 Tax=Nonomuraea sp. NPDC050328 TaxID=3364361 RepID=UPI0037AD1851
MSDQEAKRLTISLMINHLRDNPSTAAEIIGLVPDSTLPDLLGSAVRLTTRLSHLTPTANVVLGPPPDVDPGSPEETRGAIQATVKHAAEIAHLEFGTRGAEVIFVHAAARNRLTDGTSEGDLK